jgi:hypothetical protein
MVFHLQLPARPHPVQIAVDVKLQQIGRSIAGAARHLRPGPDKPRGRKVQLIAKGVNEPHRIVRANVVVHREFSSRLFRHRLKTWRRLDGQTSSQKILASVKFDDGVVASSPQAKARHLTQAPATKIRR